MAALRTAQVTILSAQTALRDEREALQAARKKALVEAEAAWEIDDEAWDAELSKLAAALADRVAAKVAAAEHLREATATLAAACNTIKSSAAERIANASAILAEVGAKKDDVEDAYLSAVQNISDGAPMRVLILSKAAVTDAQGELSRDSESTVTEPQVFLEALSARRKVRRDAEIAKAELARAVAEAKAAEEAAIEAEAVAAVAMEEEDAAANNGAGVVVAFIVIAAAAAAALLASGSVNTNDLPAALPKFDLPASVPQVDMPVNIPKLELPSADVKVDLPPAISGSTSQSVTPAPSLESLSSEA